MEKKKVYHFNSIQPELTVSRDILKIWNSKHYFTFKLPCTERIQQYLRLLFKY